jgi:hypothetical protein
MKGMRTVSSFKRNFGFLVFALSTCLVLSTPLVGSAEMHNLKAGAAKVDITPKDFIGLVGEGVSSFQGTHDPIYARALVLDNGVNSTAIVSVDLNEIGNTLPLRERIAKELAIPADHIMIAATVNHDAPRSGPVTPGTPAARENKPKTTQAYTQQVDESIVKALWQAKAALQPARMGFANGAVDVAINRASRDQKAWGGGPIEDGYVDKTVWVVKFEDLSGAPIAILMNAAVHSNASAGSPDNNIAGDIAGVAEQYVEHQFKSKAVALWTMGAAADAYPKFSRKMDQSGDPDAGYKAQELMGSTVGAEVMTVAKAINNMTPVVNIAAAERAVPCALNQNYINPGGHPGQGVVGGGPGGGPDLQPVNPGETLDIRMGLIRLNQFAITGVSGELGSAIFVHLKKVSPFTNTIMVTASNDRDGYIPEDANWDRMQKVAFTKGCAEAVIVNNLAEMMNESFQ